MPCSGKTHAVLDVQLVLLMHFQSSGTYAPLRVCMYTRTLPSQSLCAGTACCTCAIEAFSRSLHPPNSLPLLLCLLLPLQSCAPVLVLGISLLMHLQSPWPLWSTLLVLAISAGAGLASYEGQHIFWFWRSTGLFLQAAIAVLQASGIFLQAGSICMLQKALQQRVDTLPHAMSLGGRTSSSGSSLLRTSSSASTSSRASSSSTGCVSDEEDVVMPAGPPPLAVQTHIAWYAMLVLAAPALLLEAPKLVATFAGWKAALPTLLASSSTFTVYCLLTIVAVQASSALTVSLMEVTTTAAVSLGTAFLYPWHSSFAAGMIPPMQWGGLGVAVLGLALYAWGRALVVRAGQLKQRLSLEAPIKTAAYWAAEDPAKVMKCSGTDAMVYIQPHRVRQVSASPWVQQQKQGFRPLVAVQDVMETRTPVSNLQQQQWQPQQQLVYCR